MIYRDDRYIYPPRPENKFPASGMDKFDNGKFMAQPKFNGSCVEIYLNLNDWKIMNRHNEKLNSFKIDKNEFNIITPDSGTNLIVGEYMNKSKKDENGDIFNNKFIIFDILVYNNEYLIGKTFKERIDLLYNQISIIDENRYSYKLSRNIYITKTFYGDFLNLWNDFIKIDMLEGLVLKIKNAGLEYGFNSKNNNKTQLKCRKPTKNYSF